MLGVSMISSGRPRTEGQRVPARPKVGEALASDHFQQTSTRFLLPAHQTSAIDWRRQRRLNGRQHLAREGIFRQSREFLEQLVR